jgi:zinc transporter 7
VWGTLRLGAVLNLIADLSHNFTDGMALAASFQASYAVGLSTTLAVLIHEIPHEVLHLRLAACFTLPSITFRS